MNLRVFCIVLVFLYSHSPAHTQSVPVIPFEDLDAIINTKNDTTYVINFWATWCKPCVEEMPYFEALHEKYKDDKIKVVLISLDFKSQLDKRVVPFVENRNLQPYVALLDGGNPNDWIDKVDPSWSGAIPATLFISGEKRRFLEQSFHDLESLESIIQSIN